LFILGEYLKFRLVKHHVYAFLTFTVLIIAFQQCSRVPLELEKNSTLALESLNPFAIAPPLELPKINRYVFFVDMSNSMIAGPCPQDVDNGPYFSTSTKFAPYDPNIGTGNSNDQRTTGIDCQIDPEKPIARSSIVANPTNILNGNFLKTTLGVDHEADRLKAINEWLLSIQAHSQASSLNQAKVMIIPFSGGEIGTRLQTKLATKLKMPKLHSFNPLGGDPISGVPFKLVSELQAEHNTNLTTMKSVSLDRWDERTMGVSSFGSYVMEAYERIKDDMTDLNKQGLLSYATYHIVVISDGRLTSSQKHFSDVFSIYEPCKACAAGKNSCPVGVCTSLLARMEQAWGNPEDNTIDRLDFNIGLIQALPSYFGSGQVQFDFVQVKKSRLESLHPGEKTVYADLKAKFAERQSTFNLWSLNDAKTPFTLRGLLQTKETYQLDRLIILNLNSRTQIDGETNVDSDGDGVSDDDEIKLRSNPLKARSNGVCLDSLAVNAAYSDRCFAMVGGRTCDEHLDSDGDSLNECEEQLLGTDPFQFDSDNDSIPDSIEWLYGYNPQFSDNDKDSNSDGILNILNLYAGLGPEHFFSRIRPANMIQYEVNYKGKELYEITPENKIWSDLYQVKLRNVPFRTLMAGNRSQGIELFSTRPSLDPAARLKNQIPESAQLIGTKAAVNQNTLLVLTRMVAKNDPLGSYWSMMKIEAPTDLGFKETQIDLGKLKQLRTMDR
jgi:hypothetical protein